jgi:hypothetical protein
MSYNRSDSASGGGAGLPSSPRTGVTDEAGHAITRSDGWSNPKGFGWLEGQLPPAGFRGADAYTAIGPGSAAFANNPAKFTTGDQRRSPRRKPR